jgi:hypothetical protein
VKTEEECLPGYSSTPLQPTDVSSPWWVWICLPPWRFLECKHILTILIGPKKRLVRPEPAYIINFDTRVKFYDPIADEYVLYNAPHFEVKGLLGWQFRLNACNDRAAEFNSGWVVRQEECPFVTETSVPVVKSEGELC